MRGIRLTLFSLQLPDVAREQRDPVGRRGHLADDVEAAQVLAGDVGVGADVQDVDAFCRVPQMVYGHGGDAAGDQRLAQAASSLMRNLRAESGSR